MSVNYSLSKRDVMQHEGVRKVYATTQVKGTMKLDEFSEHIASHGSVWGSDVITGVLIKAVECLQEKLLEGYSIQMGNLGTFSLNIVNADYTKLPDEMDDYRPSNHIQALRVQWYSGPKFKNLIQRASFEQVTTRTAQAAVMTAIRNGETTVDLTKISTPATNKPTDQVPDKGDGDGGGSSDGDDDGFGGI